MALVGHAMKAGRLLVSGLFTTLAKQNSFKFVVLSQLLERSVLTYNALRPLYPSPYSGSLELIGIAVGKGSVASPLLKILEIFGSRVVLRAAIS